MFSSRGMRMNNRFSNLSLRAWYLSSRRSRLVRSPVKNAIFKRYCVHMKSIDSLVGRDMEFEVLISRVHGALEHDLDTQSQQVNKVVTVRIM